MRHCRVPCASGCRGGRATFTGQEYVLLFKGGRRLSTNMETALKNVYAFSNIVVKLCEIFICPTSRME
jgi:hypothetical protein